MLGKEEGRKTRKWLAALIAIMFIIGVIGVPIFSTTMFYSISVGEAGLLVDPLTRSISEPVIGPTWGVKAPWVTLKTIYYATDNYEDEIDCFSSDQLEMGITVLMRWQLNVSKLRELYLSFPRLDYEQTAIDSIMEETIRLITKEYTTLETIEHRDLVAQRMEDEIIQKITESRVLVGALYHIEFDLKNIAYPAKYTSAIEDKLVAEQKKIQAEFEKDRILVLANASAQEVLIKAQAESEAKILVSEGTMLAIENIMKTAGVTNSTRIAELYLWVEAMKQLNISTFIIVTGEDGVPLIYQIPGNTTAP